MVKSKQYDHYRSSRSGGISSSTSVVLYQSYEASPLLPGRTHPTRTSTSRLRQVGGWFLLALAFAFLAFKTGVHLRFCPPDSATRDLIRLEWKNERTEHEILQKEWERRRQEQTGKEERWEHAMEEHERAVLQRIHEEHERQESVRREWDRETERHKREFEELMSRERKERELERQRWRREVEERDRREEEERLRRNMFWGRVEAHICTTYATREYTAQLMSLPRDWKHRVDACKATPLDIHGISHLPTTCEDRGPGVVIGRWEISEQEPDCTTFWDEYNDKGCTSPGSGKKYITHKLMNLPDKSDWKEFCATTPARFNHMEFPGAQECFTSVWGVYGQWEIDDGNC